MNSILIEDEQESNQKRYGRYIDFHWKTNKKLQQLSKTSSDPYKHFIKPSVLSGTMKAIQKAEKRLKEKNSEPPQSFISNYAPVVLRIDNSGEDNNFITDLPFLPESKKSKLMKLKAPSISIAKVAKLKKNFKALRRKT